jgi:hypothetical protein
MATVRYAPTAAQAAANNFILAKGELGYTADNDVLKVGDGVRPWNDLEAVSGGGGGGGLTQEQVEDVVGAMVTGNTETNITVTYDDTAGKLNFVAGVGYTDEAAQDAVGGMFTGNTETRIALTYDDAGAKINAVVDAFPVFVPFFIPGTLVVGAGATRIYNPSGRTVTLKKIQFHAITAPTGSAATLDFNISGTTVFTTQGNRPSASAASNVSSVGTPDTAAAAWADTQYITVDVDAVGSTVAGADITGMIYGEI